jgi:AmmeMemoRadiSam system protein A
MPLMDDAKHGDMLIKLAREAIAERFGTPPQPPPHEAWLSEPGATFVTLTQHGDLRGCIGSLAPYRPLLEDVRANAFAAAFRDQRFEPLREAELSYTLVEVSLLSPMQPLIFDSEQAALAQLRPGIDGVVFEYLDYRSTFLPQVWEQLPLTETFMAHLKRKAGLPGNFWAPEVRLSRYTVEKWKEPNPGTTASTTSTFGAGPEPD